MEENVITKWLSERFEEVAPRDFYRGIFPSGELERKEEYVTGKYTGIIVAVTGRKKSNGKSKVKRYSITDELDAVETAVNSDDFCLCSPLSYAGKNRTAERARFLYAIAVDVDKIRMRENTKTGDKEPIGLVNLWHQVETYAPLIKREYLPKPTYIVSSGTGLHLYYVLVQPLPLYPGTAFALQEYKRALTEMIWNDTIVKINSKADIQQEGIYQGFRMPGTVTKNGDRARAFLTGEKVTMEYLNKFVGELNRVKGTANKRGGVTLSEAAEKWPEWYERRIERGEKRGVWHVSRKLYDWWKDEIKKGAAVGHRYYCIMMLAIFAQKCSYYDEKHNPNPVTLEELEQDAYGLIDFMESKTNEDDNHFTEADVQDALEAFQDRWTRYPRRVIEYRSGISIPETKRNGRDQETHLKIARNTLNVLNDVRGETLQGRKSKAEIVIAWKKEHPNGKKADCIYETGLSKPTVYKYWEVKTPEDLAEQKQKEQRVKELQRRIVARLEQQRETLKAYEKDAAELREVVSNMPEGEEKEKYKKMIAIAEEDIAGIKADLLGADQSGN